MSRKAKAMENLRLRTREKSSDRHGLEVATGRQCFGNSLRSRMGAKWIHQLAFQILWTQWKQMNVIRHQVSVQNCYIVVAAAWLHQIDFSVTYCCCRPGASKFKATFGKRYALPSALVARSCQYVVRGVQATCGPNLLSIVIHCCRHCRIVPIWALLHSATHVTLKRCCSMSGCLPLHVLCICSAGGSTWLKSR